MQAWTSELSKSRRSWLRTGFSKALNCLLLLPLGLVGAVRSALRSFTPTLVAWLWGQWVLCKLLLHSLVVPMGPRGRGTMFTPMWGTWLAESLCRSYCTYWLISAQHRHFTQLHATRYFSSSLPYSEIHLMSYEKGENIFSLPQESLPNVRTKKLWQAAFWRVFHQSELEFNTGYVVPSEDWLKKALKSRTWRKNDSS